MNKNEFKTKLFYIIQEESPAPEPKPGPAGKPKLGKLGSVLGTLKRGPRGIILNYALLDIIQGQGSLAGAGVETIKGVGDVATGRSAIFGAGPFNPNKGFKRT